MVMRRVSVSNQCNEWCEKTLATIVYCYCGQLLQLLSFDDIGAAAAGLYETILDEHMSYSD